MYGMKKASEIYDIAVKELTQRVPEASLKFISCDGKSLSNGTGCIYNLNGTHYTVTTCDMGKLIVTRELYSEDDCLWDMIQETILCSCFKKKEYEEVFRRFEDLFPENVERAIRYLPL